jgi:hypothetical protein
MYLYREVLPNQDSRSLPSMFSILDRWEPTDFAIPQKKTTSPQLFHPTSHKLENYSKKGNFIGCNNTLLQTFPVSHERVLQSIFSDDYKHSVRHMGMHIPGE